MMNSQEMETAVRLKLNLVVLILEDNAYGMIRWKQAVDGFADYGMTFGNPDFVAMPRPMAPRAAASRATDGLWCRRSKRPSTAAACIWSSIPIDYSENVRVLVDELRNREASGADLD